VALGDAPIVHSVPELGGYGITHGRVLVTTFHGFNLDDQALQQASKLQRLFYRYLVERYVRRALSKSLVITAVSAYTATVVEQHLGVSPQIIPNGVDLKRFRPCKRDDSDGRMRVLFAGNPRRQKGIELVSQLAIELEDCCEFLFAGGLRALSRRDEKSMRGVAPDDMPRLYSKADVLILPTFREGMSLVTLEAMASGLPVVTSDIPAQAELIEHAKGGFLVPIQDKVGFASALRQLAGSIALRAEMGAFNRDKAVARFSLESMLRRYRELFDNLVA
jgi:glycosyltransferase involved in cell wall biosynthesis